MPGCRPGARGPGSLRSGPAGRGRRSRHCRAPEEDRRSGSCVRARMPSHAPQQELGASDLRSSNGCGHSSPRTGRRWLHELSPVCSPRELTTKDPPGSAAMKSSVQPSRDSPSMLMRQRYPPGVSGRPIGKPTANWIRVGRKSAGVPCGSLGAGNSRSRSSLRGSGAPGGSVGTRTGRARDRAHG